LERKRSITFDKLIDQIAQGRRDDDAVSSLAGRLAAMDHRIEDEDRARISAAGNGTTLKSLAGGLLNAISPDIVEAKIVERHGSVEAATKTQAKAIADELKDAACAPLDDPKLRNLIKDIKQKTDILIAERTPDEVVSAGYDIKHAEARVQSFRNFIEANKNELLALQILYGQPYAKRRLTYAAIRELAQRLADPPYHLTTADVWQAYKRIEAALVRGAPSDKVLTDIISLVRFATGQIEALEPYSARVEQKFNLWIGRQIKAGKQFTEEQMNWLKAIRDYLAANVEIVSADLQRDTPFSAWGGVIAARKLFGEELNGMLDEMTEALAA